MLYAILDNLRSIHNVGSTFRTADGLGVDRLILCGTTPHPHPDESWRRDHLALTKTALGAEQTVNWEYQSDIHDAIHHVKQNNFRVIGLETEPSAMELQNYHPLPGDKIALIIGNEPDGLSPEVLASCDEVLKIPMLGDKESLNVSVAFGIAVYWLKYQRTD